MALPCFSQINLTFKQQEFLDLSWTENEHQYQKLSFKNTSNRTLILDTIISNYPEVIIRKPQLAKNLRFKDTLLSKTNYFLILKWSTWNQSGDFTKKIKLSFHFKNHKPIIKTFQFAGYIKRPAKLSFDSLVHNVGPIPEGPPYEFKFRFENTGSVPVTINKIRSSCGCLVPYWDKEEVLPGEYGMIKGIFHTKKRVGYFYKSMTITTNAHTRRFGANPITLRIKGNVFSKAQKNKDK